MNGMRLREGLEDIDGNPGVDGDVIKTQRRCLETDSCVTIKGDSCN